MKKRLQVVWFVIFVFGLLSLKALAAQDTNAASTDRILAILTVPPLEPAPAPDQIVQLYVDAIQTSVDAGANGNLNAEVWSKLEPAPGQYTLDDMVNNLNYRVTTYNQILMVGIQVINTTAKETPSDLLNVAFDDPQMIQRFHAFLDALLPRLNHNVFYFSVGNEVDAYLGAHPDQWKAYTAFYTDAVNYIHRAASWVKVGVTVTFNGALAHPDEVRALTAASDIAILTYYPLEGDFVTRSPASPLDDFPQMLNIAGDRPLVLQEVGYPSSTVLGGSEVKQAAFVANVFAAWEAAGSRIPFLSFFSQGDFSEDFVSQFSQYYGLTQDEHFKEFIRTLGMRRVDGTPKLAWDILAAEAARFK